ncbi:MAG: putative LmbE-like protein [Bacteroidetes bacterium]|nr:putative LmbE-like protein [Bacteroidota bacterium]
MLNLVFGHKTKEPLRILCLGAHCDDIEIGCGGTILKLIDSYPESIHRWVTIASTPARATEATDSFAEFMKPVKQKHLDVKDFRDGFFPYDGARIKDYVESLKSFSPDIIFTHRLEDRHQDHRVVSELTWNTFRNHLVFEYEIPKYEGDLGQPNVFVSLDESICNKKIEYTLGAYTSQKEKHWFTRDMLLALMRIRGVESVSPTSYAEAFHCRKILM